MLLVAGSFLAAGCSPRAQTSIDPESLRMLPMSDSWSRIHKWLAANAPKIMQGLNAPATGEEIQSTERALGMEMPEEWRDLYRTHNGLSDKPNLGSLFYGMQFLTLEQILLRGVNEPSDDKPEPVRAADAGIKMVDFHNPKWVSLAEDWGDCQIRVDFDPATNGTRGQVIMTDQTYGTVILLAPSISHLLSDFASDLEGGRYFLNAESLKDGNEYLSCVQEIDVINWYKSPRWKHLER
jgi:cell wall assembly regulator SMI1